MRPVRTGVDVFDDRVFLCRIERRRTHDDAPDVRLAVAAFGDEDLGWLPATLDQLADIAPLDLGDERAVGQPPQLRYRSQVDTRVSVDVVLQIGRNLYVVIG